MPGSPRIEFPGAICHVLARGDHREPIVLGDDDRWMFLRTLGEMAKRTGIRVHAFALMDRAGLVFRHAGISREAA